MARQGAGVLHAMSLLPRALPGLMAVEPIEGPVTTIGVLVVTLLIIEDQN
jgi:hypothetical protein